MFTILISLFGVVNTWRYASIATPIPSSSLLPSKTQNKEALRREIKNTQDKLEAINNKMNRLESSDPNNTHENLDEGFQNRIQQQQEKIAMLEAERQSVESFSLKRQESEQQRTNQEALILKAVLDDLQRSIQSEENNLQIQRQRIRATIAPADSDMMQAYQNQLRQDEEKLQNLRDQYMAVLYSEEQQIASEYNRRLQNQWSQEGERIELQMRIADAKSQLQKLNQDAVKAKQQEAGQLAQLDRLRAEREQLSQLLTQQEAELKHRPQT